MDRHNSQNWHISVDGPPDPENWEQDEDVLDTWFSSAIWPLGVLGWPDEKMMKEMGFDYFYPTMDLVTGPDIIFFWVARMIISGLNLLEGKSKSLSREEIQRRIPFKNVYFTGIIRDHVGRKMSKSLGNSPDPLNLIEKYGADCVRIGLLLIAPSGQDILFSEERVAQGKKLCTKLWNSFRFRQQNGMEDDRSSINSIVEHVDVGVLEVDDIVILWKLLNSIDEFENTMADYEFNRAIQILYNFFWNDYCDWYIEISKSRISATVLAIHDFILRQLLLLLHPFIPFITEELWHDHGYGTKFLAEELLESGDRLRHYLAKIDFQNIQTLMEEVKLIQELVVAARAMKAQFGLSANRNVSFHFKADSTAKAIIGRHLRDIKHLLLTRIFDETDETLELPMSAITLGFLYIDIAKGLDIGAEKKRIRHEIERLNQLITINEKKLHNEDFLGRAPKEVIVGAKNLLAENITKKGELESVYLKLSMID